MSCSIGKHTHTGWNPQETEQLFALAEAAQQSGRPLKAVFDEVAAANGRRPNSVRNFYYARVKESNGGSYTHKRAFLPFTDEEAELLVEEVLRAQANGESVRSCTLRLANGSDRAMLRYQNKYRALLKNNPALVRRVSNALAARGMPTFDPFALQDHARRAGRPRKQTVELPRLVEQLLSDLDQIEGCNAHALIATLAKLAAAARSASVAAPVEPPAPGTALRIENEALRRELAREHTRYKQLLGYFTQLIRINSEFLSLNSVVKVSNLSTYIHDLESNVKTCERVMIEEAR